MHITLRQAHKLVEKITAKMATIDLNPTVELNVWELESVDTVKEALERHSEAFDLLWDRQINLQIARGYLRRTIGEANALEIDALVAARKHLLDEIGNKRHVLSNINLNYAMSAQAVFEKASAQRTSTSPYGSSDRISVSLFNSDEKETLEEEIAALQLRIEAIEDQLTTANGKVISIAGAPAVIQTLRNEGLMQ